MAVNKIEYAGKVLLDLTEDTVTQDKMISGTVGHDRTGQKIIGSMPDIGTVVAAISNLNDIYAIPEGYHDGNGKVSIDENELKKLVAENIKKGVTILGVVGTYDGNIGPIVDNYTEIRGIFIDRNCYFDTEIRPDQNTNVDIQMYIKGTSKYIYGAMDDACKYGCGKQDNFYAVRGIASSSEKKYTFWDDTWTIKQEGATVSFNGNKVYLDKANDFLISSPLYIGTMSKNSASAGDGMDGIILYAKIFSGTTLVADMIPVKKSDGTLCLYDKVRNKYLYNKGSGKVTQFS